MSPRPVEQGRGRVRFLGTPLPWLAALLLLYLLAPLGAFVTWAAGAPRGALTAPGVGDALIVSLETATIATAVITVLGVPLAYLLAQAHGRTAALLGMAVQLPLALPPLMSGILMLYIVGPYAPLGRLFGGRLTDHAAGIVLAQVFVAAPFLIIAARSAFAALDPDLADVSATLGHGRLSRFVRVALPGAAPGIQAGLLLAWLRAFGEFGATVVLAYHPYSLPVYTYVQFGSTGLAATLLPVAVSLAAAVAVLAVNHCTAHLRLPHRRRTAPPAPRAPRARTSPRLAFDLRARSGSFHLRVAHTARGRHLAILGPSGAGKSLTLRLVAGLIRPDEGYVRLDDDDLTALPPERRGVGYVPQDVSLIPHLAVWQQVTFGVDTDPALAAYWLRRLDLDGLQHRLPHQLSGGQRRRVALARALARDPRLLLLDEPFTGLDTLVRDELRWALRRLQQGIAPTTVIITHDPQDAALLAEDILILAHGRLLQAGDQREVFAHPATPEAARLLGIRNLHTGRLTGPHTLDVDGAHLTVTATGLPAGTPVAWCIRPEDIQLTATGGHPATIIDTVHLGPVTEIRALLANGHEMSITVTPQDISATTDGCRIHLPPEAITVWPAPADSVQHPLASRTSRRQPAEGATGTTPRCGPGSPP
ncbi:ATP-binding cassette domain-containing protein [Streptomyces sp. MMS24-I2-30]|uniref:ABC transporter ATP-binding protein/permease n=1 Tax=Streptomyces sp. MMS24-I2-30 TaxID=3351564 RepID=UPI0038969E64